MRQVTTTKRYRCFTHPVDRDGIPIPAETGVLPFVQLRATDAEDAQRRAHAVTGRPVVRVERIEVAA